MANLRNVVPGQPINGLSASDWNAMLDLVKQSRLGGRASSVAGGRLGIVPATQVLIKNDSGSDVGRLAILGIDQPVILPADNESEFNFHFSISAISPTDDHRGKFVVTAESIPAGKMGLAFVDGLVACLVDVSHAYIMRCDVVAANTAQLGASLYGAAHILWKEAGTGVKRALVRLAPPTDVELSGEADADINPGASGTVSIFDGGVDTGVNVTAQLDRLHGGQKVSAGKEVAVRYYSTEQILRVVLAECET
jgi:hypothetical protein